MTKLYVLISSNKDKKKNTKTLSSKIVYILFLQPLFRKRNLLKIIILSSLEYCNSATPSNTSDLFIYLFIIYVQYMLVFNLTNFIMS